MAARLSHNIIATFLGKGWSALIAVAFVPVYIKFMGIEAYGLVGLFTTLLVLSSGFDLGLSTALARELAGLSTTPRSAEKSRNLAHTFQAICWIFALGPLLLLAYFGYHVGGNWVSGKDLDENTVRNAFLLMGMAVAFQFPFMLYSGGLLGLQRQVPLNIFVALLATVRALGAWLMLWLIAPTIQVFFAWQIFVSLLQSVLSGAILWRFLPKSEERLRIDLSAVSRIWRFALGMSLINIFAIALTQVDKLILSAMLPLNEFGYYSLASTIAFGLLMLSAPFFSGLFPRFTQLIKEKDSQGTSRLYHSASQVLAVIAIPPCLVIAFFSREILLLWIQDAGIAEEARSLVRLLVLGSALNSLMYIPYALQIAHGWTRLSVIQNFLAVLVLIPLLYIAIERFGAEGAASVWILLNAGYLGITIPIMHTRLLKGEKWSWYWNAVCLPFVGGALPMWMYYVLISGDHIQGAPLSQIIGLLFLAWMSAVLITPHPREMAVKYALKVWDRFYKGRE